MLLWTLGLLKNDLARVGLVMLGVVMLLASILAIRMPVIFEEALEGLLIAVFLVFYVGGWIFRLANLVSGGRVGGGGGGGGGFGGGGFSGRW